ncbi:LOW QUALITY PROTEIN: hypothetical protein U9M48_022101 [Paspalum notatum var. saurae]|uniref:RING-type domain-containing protein n=1 Tax=Paspalum notatum var. saurae TaxID=547442 RepID=A0AAQ3WTD4_PASNO
MAGVTVSVLLLVAGVVAMLVLHILIVVWALRRGVELRAAAEGQGDEERAAAPPGLSTEELGALPCHERKAGGDGGGGECAVCLEAMRAGERCRVLPRCDHGFHAQCVDPWLRRSRVCPVCRADVLGHAKAAAGTVAGASSDAVAGTGRDREARADRPRSQLFAAGIWGFRTQPARVISEHAEEGGAGLSSEEVSELPCHDCKEGGAAGGGDCAVCLEAFRPGERCRVLPGCGHGFHAECVDSWLRKSRRCPICRAEVVAGHGKNTGAVSAPVALEIVTER